MVASSLFFDFSKYCPHPSCGEPVELDARFCLRCEAGVIYCHVCRATNRLLALHCRACGASLDTEVWPMQAGLKASRVSSKTINSIEGAKPPAPYNLGAALLTPLIAADGIIIAPLGDGSIALISEFLGKEIGRLRVSEPIRVTPVISRGFLSMGAGRNILTFDLPQYLDQKFKLDFKPAWSFTTAGSAIIKPLLADEKAIYVVSGDGSRTTLEAVSSDDGVAVWAEPVSFGSYRVTPPLLVKDYLVVMTSEGEANLIDRVEGVVLDNFSLGRRVDLQVAPCVTGNRLLFADTNNNIVEVQVTAGGLLTSVLHRHRARVTCLAASNDYIAIGHMAGLTLLNSRGHSKWSNDSIEPILVAPIVAGDSVFAVDSSGTGLLFDALRSNPKARVKLLSGEINASPILTKSKIVAANQGGDIVAILWS